MSASMYNFTHVLVMLRLVIHVLVIPPSTLHKIYIDSLITYTYIN